MSVVRTIMWVKGLLTEEEITQTVRMFNGQKRITSDKYLIVKAFVKTCLKEAPEAITPTDEIYNAFMYFCKVAGITQPIIKKTGLTSLLMQHITFTQTRTWRGHRQVRAYKGIQIWKSIRT